MSYPGSVHIAEANDEEEIMQLCRDLWAENALFAIDEPKVRIMLRKAFNREGGILGVIGKPGKFEAMVYMQVSTFWYSSDPVLEELFAFVKPEYRKTKNAIELLQFSKWCTNSSGIPLLMGIMSNERTAGKVRLYQRQLGTPIGNFFLYKKSEEAA